MAGIGEIQIGNLNAQCHWRACISLNWQVVSLAIFDKIAKLPNQKPRQSFPLCGMCVLLYS